MAHKVVCHHCQATIAVTGWVGESEALRMLDHLRAAHAEMLDGEEAPAFGELLEHFGVRET